MHSQIYGKEENPAVVFLHGYGAHPKLYKDFTDRLAENHRVYVPEIFGLNGICRRDFAENMQALGRFLAEHGLLESIVIGHSYGALAALHAAAEFTSLKKAIAVNPLLPEMFNPQKFRLQLGNMQRDLKYATGELSGMLSNPKVGLTYGMNLIADPLGYIDGAVRAVASVLPERRSPVPAEIIYADLDTLFHIEDTDLGRWREVLPELRFTAVPDYSHNWLIYHGSFAYETMRAML